MYYSEGHQSCPKKIYAIKAIRECLGVHLKEAKDLVEDPEPICLGTTPPNGILGALLEAGCQVVKRPDITFWDHIHAA
jgi:ribosomal protein L7/L12